jgi:hypothetical protein
MAEDKNLYKKIPSHIEEIKHFEANILMISAELENILKFDDDTQKDLMIDLTEKIDKIIQVLEINQNDDGFIAKFYSDIFSEIVLIASKINNTNRSSENKKITALIEILKYTREEVSKIIKQANMLNEQSFA